ncbi:MAG TPA: hypothetical protein VIC25_04810 [Caulobacteraceae bacterium]
MAADPERRIDIGQEQARGARHVGLIWMLVASLAIAVVVLAIVVAWYAGALNQANLQGGPGAIPKASAQQFHTPAAAPASP